MEKLYNNIVLPDEWPPKYSREQYLDKQPTPYLDNPPEVIDISIGRQLFVDNFLIEETDLTPEYHSAKKFEGNPILRPETKIETQVLPVATPKSGGVWYDMEEKKHKMWYEAGWLSCMAYAESEDGINWVRPKLDIEEGTNKILPFDETGEPIKFVDNNQDDKTIDLSYLRADSTTVFIDYDTKDKSQRYKMILRNPGAMWPAIAMTSADGIHWENLEYTMPVYDRTTMFYNPFRKKWVFSIRSLVFSDKFEPGWGRSRDYLESDEFLTGFADKTKAVNWLTNDRDNKPLPYIGFPPQLYNVDAVAYESIMLGMFQIMYGPENNKCEQYDVPKITELIPMYSRDGFHFTRPSEKAIVNASIYKGAWDRGYVQSVGGICTIHKDELWIYYIGFSGVDNFEGIRGKEGGMYGGGATGIAKLRRDGFVSMNGTGMLLTRKITFDDKKYIFANFEGKLKVEILDENKNVLAVSEVSGDSTCQYIPFDNFDISSLNNKAFRIRFTMEEGKIYSFWFSKTKNGESNGFKAAGEIK